MNHELSIITNDGWVITLLADEPMTLGDAVLSSVIVQPKEDYAKRSANDADTPRCLYRINAKGVVVYEHDKNIAV